jgi:hypothetical protein
VSFTHCDFCGEPWRGHGTACDHPKLYADRLSAQPVLEAAEGVVHAAAVRMLELEERLTKKRLEYIKTMRENHPTIATTPGGNCRVCGLENIDEAWEKLVGPGEVGIPNLRIGQYRHDHTGLDAMRKWLPDDNDIPRCLTCLREVPKEFALDGMVARRTDGTLERLPSPIGVRRIETGNEVLCCGATP